MPDGEWLSRVRIFGLMEILDRGAIKISEFTHT